jgi:hypothetical protein
MVSKFRRRKTLANFQITGGFLCLSLKLDLRSAARSKGEVTRRIVNFGVFSKRECQIEMPVDPEMFNPIRERLLRPSLGIRYQT